MYVCVLVTFELLALRPMVCTRASLVRPPIYVKRTRTWASHNFSPQLPSQGVFIVSVAMSVFVSGSWLEAYTLDLLGEGNRDEMGKFQLWCGCDYRHHGTMWFRERLLCHGIT